MNTEHLLQVIADGEGLHTEFKEATNKLPSNLFDTICAFLNTDGGMIFLGISDKGDIVGVEPQAAGQMKIDIANQSNNLQKIDLPYLLFPYQTEIDGKTIIVIHVPLSSQLHKHKGNIFLRSEDGDFRVQGTHQLAGLINRKLGIFTEQRPIGFSSMADLRPECLIGPGDSCVLTTPIILGLICLTRNYCISVDFLPQIQKAERRF